ncbi:putative Uncharacterized 50.6 kDa protein in the 5'region of gyrA and gyrB [uncultured Microbacterium sp.]|uniref:Putative Uncharacterized 50.6 kDa protein in the 5'region of gyrA and gyrB n=1 Tax=uncultured Microbacterium sp. TaxID=191216 RepID=A0A1Y5P584_9MICO|nr:putative Uncharacterized 50.6 kDa protein in the 5'region of gyrA and gyrB [uncultured Microbacterium sp.]
MDRRLPAARSALRHPHRRHDVRLPVGVRAARDRQPRGDGVRRRRRRHRDRRDPRGRRGRRDGPSRPDRAGAGRHGDAAGSGEVRRRSGCDPDRGRLRSRARAGLRRGGPGTRRGGVQLGGDRRRHGRAVPRGDRRRPIGWRYAPRPRFRRRRRPPQRPQHRRSRGLDRLRRPALGGARTQRGRQDDHSAAGRDPHPPDVRRRHDPRRAAGPHRRVRAASPDRLRLVGDGQADPAGGDGAGCRAHGRVLGARPLARGLRDDRRAPRASRPGRVEARAPRRAHVRHPVRRRAEAGPDRPFRHDRPGAAAPGRAGRKPRPRRARGAPGSPRRLRADADDARHDHGDPPRRGGAGRLHARPAAPRRRDRRRRAHRGDAHGGEPHGDVRRGDRALRGRRTLRRARRILNLIESLFGAFAPQTLTVLAKSRTPG